MLTKRVIACLDVKDGRTVKGVNFESLRDAGDAVELARSYVDQGVDELVFLDISATLEKRRTLLTLVEKIATCVNIPFTVGGGITSAEIVSDLLSAGADKISVNSAAVRSPLLVRALARRFGSQCIVGAIDAKQDSGEWRVFVESGRMRTEWTALAWAIELQELGAGEILLTSIDNDGTKSGFALDLTRQVSSRLSIPVIASGGAGVMPDFVDVLVQGRADATLAAGVFHSGLIKIPDLKRYLSAQGIEVRL